MQDKAIALALFLNMVLGLVVSIAIPLVIKTVQIGYIFLTFGVLTVIGTVIIIIFMRETRGKT